MIFECNGQPFTKYCGQAEFQGITKEDDEVEREYWFYAWRLIGLCETDTSTSLMQSSFPICPPTYDASDVSYMDGDAVEVEGTLYCIKQFFSIDSSTTHVVKLCHARHHV